MRNLLLSTVTLLVVPAVGLAAPDFYSHTHTTPIELKPISSSSGLKLAGVCFLGAGDCGDGGFGSIDGDGGYDVDSETQCINEGYVKNNCNSVQTPTAYCPYDKSYISGCKCASNLISCPAGQVGEGDACEGKYASCKCDPNLISCPSNKTGSGVSCGGKYETCVCKAEYQYTSSNCISPRSLSGSSCDGKYTECSCPKGVDEGEFGCKEYYASPCSSVCKVAYPDNCHSRTDNNSQTYGCMKYYDDCPTKCETPYKDNCRNRTEVTVPANATCSTYFSDCSSKCSEWKCASGYELKDGICTQTCGTNYVYDDSNCPTDSYYHCSKVCNNKYSDCKTLLWTGNLVYKAGQPYAISEQYCPGPVKDFTAHAQLFIEKNSISNGKNTYRLCSTGDQTCHNIAMSAIYDRKDTPNDITINVSADMNCGNEVIYNSDNWYGAVNMIINGNGHTFTFDSPSGYDFYNGSLGSKLTIKNSKIVSRVSSLPYDENPCPVYDAGTEYNRGITRSTYADSNVILENVTIETQHAVGDRAIFNGNNSIKMVSGGVTSATNKELGYIDVQNGTTKISGFSKTTGLGGMVVRGGVTNLNMQGKKADLYMLGGTINVCADSVVIYRSSTGGVVNSSTSDVDVPSHLKDSVKINVVSDLCDKLAF